MNSNLNILPKYSVNLQTSVSVHQGQTIPQTTFKAVSSNAASDQREATVHKPAPNKGFFRTLTTPLMALLAALPLVGAGCVPAPSSSTNSGAGVESIQQVGNTSFSTNGTTTTRMGNVSIGSDGTVYNHIGNTSIGSNGQVYNRIGNTSIGSDGSIQFHFP
jgi:hypothetical protein